MNFENITDDVTEDGPNFYDLDYRPQRHEEHATMEQFDSPKKIFDYLNSHVYGHTDYKKALSLFLWKHKNGHPTGALLVAGASGSGKTEAIRVLSKIYNNIHISDGASTVPNGYKGDNTFANQLSTLDFEDAECPPILAIDEFDKLLSKATTPNGWGGSSLLSETLKFIEGGTYNAGTTDKPRRVDTSKLAVILLGSFLPFTESEGKLTRGIGFNADINSRSSSDSPLSKELIIEQLPPELQGRIGQILILDPLSEEDYYRILKDDRYSPAARLSREYGLSLSISDEKYHEIAHEAYVSHTGVRSMNNTIASYLDEQLFSRPDLKEMSIM